MLQQIGSFFAALRLPGVFWIALVGFAIAWLPSLFPGAPWLDKVLLILAALAKALEVMIAGQQPPPPSAVRALRADEPKPQGFDWRRFLIG